MREAAKNDADIVSAAARRIDEIFNPDGDFDEEDRARRRGLTLGGQAPTAASPRPAMSAARRSVPCKREVPRAQGVKLGLKAGIASGGLGAHRGHAVTVIVRTTLAELDQAAHAVTHPEVPMPGPARTGGDSALPMREAIRMAADSIHYLAVFHEHTGRPIDLGRQARIATADQRIICYANECFGYAL